MYREVKFVARVILLVPTAACWDGNMFFMFSAGNEPKQLNHIALPLKPCHKDFDLSGIRNKNRGDHRTI